MGRASTKQNKNRYQLVREELGLTREKAEALLETVSADRIEKVESGKCRPYPDEVLTMAEKYGRPSLCNFYCANECPIGREYVPEVKMKELSAIVLEMLASLNAVDKKGTGSLRSPPTGESTETRSGTLSPSSRSWSASPSLWRPCSSGRRKCFCPVRSIKRPMKSG